MPARQERIDFDGESWTILTRLTHGAIMDVEEATKPWFRVSNPTINGEGRIGGEVEFDIANWDSHSADDALLLAQTVEWSYGPVRREVLRGVPEEHRALVLQRLKEVIDASPLAQRPGLVVGPSADGSPNPSTSP